MKIDFLKVKGRRYKVEYDLSKLPASSQVSFSTQNLPKDTVDILLMCPYLVARLVMPMKRRFFKWVVMPHEAKDFENYVEDMRHVSPAELIAILKHGYITLLQTHIKAVEAGEGTDESKKSIVDKINDAIIEISGAEV